MTNWLDKLFPPNDPMVRAAMTVPGGVLDMSVADPEDMRKIQAMVAEWYTDREDPEHTDHVHVNPNVVAAALERQERERGRELDDLLAALDVELLPWQRDTLGRWLERKLTFRMR